MNLMNLQDTGAFIGTSRRTVRRMIDQRIIPFYRVGRLIKVAKEDLEIYLKQQRVEAE